MPSSHADDSASDRAMLSGVQAAGPMGTPHTRETTHTPRIPELRSTPVVSNDRVGRRTTAIAHDSCSHAMTAKNVPWAHDTS